MSPAPGASDAQVKRKPIEAVSKPPEARAPRNDGEKKLWLPLRPTVFEAARARQGMRQRQVAAPQPRWGELAIQQHLDR